MSKPRVLRVSYWFCGFGRCCGVLGFTPNVEDEERNGFAVPVDSQQNSTAVERGAFVTCPECSKVSKIPGGSAYG